MIEIWNFKEYCALCFSSNVCNQLSNHAACNMALISHSLCYFKWSYELHINLSLSLSYFATSICQWCKIYLCMQAGTKVQAANAIQTLLNYWLRILHHRGSHSYETINIIVLLMESSVMSHWLWIFSCVVWIKKFVSSFAWNRRTWFFLKFIASTGRTCLVVSYSYQGWPDIWRGNTCFWGG